MSEPKTGSETYELALHELDYHASLGRSSALSGVASFVDATVEAGRAQLLENGGGDVDKLIDDAVAAIRADVEQTLSHVAERLRADRFGARA